jgi:hypothetical protein
MVFIQPKTCSISFRFHLPSAERLGDEVLQLQAEMLPTGDMNALDRCAESWPWQAILKDVAALEPLVNRAGRTARITRRRGRKTPSTSQDQRQSSVTGADRNVGCRNQGAASPPWLAPCCM